MMPICSSNIMAFLRKNINIFLRLRSERKYYFLEEYDIFKEQYGCFCTRIWMPLPRIFFPGFKKWNELILFHLADSVTGIYNFSRNLINEILSFSCLFKHLTESIFCIFWIRNSEWCSARSSVIIPVSGKKIKKNIRKNMNEFAHEYGLLKKGHKSFCAVIWYFRRNLKFWREICSFKERVGLPMIFVQKYYFLKGKVYKFYSGISALKDKYYLSLAMFAWGLRPKSLN